MITFKFQNGDFSIDASGKLETVTGFEILRKNINKLLSTYKESSANTMMYNRYNPNYGHNIPFLRSVLVTSTQEELISSIQDELNSCILYYTNNIQPEKQSIPGFTADSYLKDADVTVYPSEEDNGYAKIPIIRYEVEIVSAAPSQNKSILSGVV
ncbi:MAG: hypothetical protein ABIK31_01630 [candidate division WOR-3 bacterium]